MTASRADTHTGDLFAIVPAAGAGSRMECATPKQYLELNGISILQHTISRLFDVNRLSRIVVVLDETTFNSGAHNNGAQALDNFPQVERCVGGSSRAESVINGLRHLEPSVNSESSVLVHDAARPCVRVKDINQLIATTAGDANGGLLAMPVVDTIKRSDKNMQVLETVNRDELWRAATPQLFPYSALLAALTKAFDQGLAVTDEASAMQLAGFTPRLIECSNDNIKVTTATDLVLAEHYLAAQQAGPDESQ